MADQKLTQLPPVPDPVVDADLVYLVRGTDSYQATIGQVHASITPGAAVWGAITGVIGNQTDLANALALKAPLASPALTGTPTAPTAAPGTNTTQLATTAFGAAAIVAERSAAVALTNHTISGASNTLSALPAAGISGVIPIANLATGTPTGSKFVRDDGTLAVPATSAVAWGTITGTLSDQTDLNTALGLKAPLASPALTGTPTVPTAAVDTNTTQAASTAFVVAQAASANPIIDGTAAPGTSLRYARADHVHPTDTSRAALASPTFTGTPAAPTAAPGTNTTQIATTAFVLANGGSGTVTSVSSANGDLTVATGTTTPVLTVVSAPKLTTARNINGVAFDGTGNITVTVPIATGVTGLGTGVATFLATPSSANLAAALTDETGTGALVFAGSPALTGTPTAPTAGAGTNTTQLATTAFVLANPATGTLLAANNLSDVVSASSSIKNLNAVGTYYYSIYDYTSASQRAGTADATSALQSALNAIETAMKANDGGKYILDLRDSILRIDGALVSTNSNNAQITLPALDVFADPQCTLVIRGSEQVSSSYSVIGTIPVPTKGAIIRSTLTTGGGTLPSVIAGRAPTASSWLFTSINLVFENIEIQTIANPLIGGLNAGLVNSMEMLNSSVTTGIYTANDCTVPTHSDAIGVTGPGRGNGVGNSFHNVGVIGFYTGFVLNEHAEGDVMAFACLTAVEVKQTDHAIHLQRIESAHCVTTLRATGGASRVIVDFLAIEHASGAPFVTVNDIEDTNNYMSGKANYATVLAGSGVSTVFTKNGGINFQCSNFGDNTVPYWSTLSGTTPALTFVGTPQVRTLTLSGNTTFTASGYAQGYTYSLFLTGDSSSRTLTFPAWVWLEGAPAALAASKVMQIDLVCTGTTAGSVVAVYGVQQ